MKNIVLLGGTGYIGSILSKLMDKKFHVKSIGRDTNESFIIGENFSEDIFSNADIVFYLSWMFDTLDPEYTSKNQNQLELVIDLCKKEYKIIFFSTYYAKENAQSQYSRTKFLCEEMILKNNFKVVKLGAVVIKEFSGGFYGNIVNFIKKFKVLPIFIPNKNKFYKTNLKHFYSFIECFLTSNQKIFKLYENSPVFFENLFDEMNLKFLKIKLPWRVAYYLLLSAEKLGLKLKFRSDSFLSIWGNR